MAITVDWPTKVVFIPKGEASIATLVSASPEIYDYDLDLLRLELKAIEASEEGMSFDDIHAHTPPFTIGNIQLARVVSIVNGYKLEFEDGQYQVNLVGANTDMHLATNRIVNQVSVTPQNTAGLVTTASTIDLISQAVWEKLTSDHVTPGTMGFQMVSFAYQGRVWVDPLNATGNAAAGTVAGVNGLPTMPCLTVADAKVIASAIGVAAYGLVSNTTLDSDHPGWNFLGGADIELNIAGYNVQHSTFCALRLTGNAVGNMHCKDCELSQLHGGYGEFTQCVILDDVTFAAGDTYFSWGFSGVAGSAAPIVRAAAGAKVGIRAYSGGLDIRDMNDPSTRVSVDLIAGQVVFDASCVDGVAVVRGVGKLTNNSAGALVDSQELVGDEPKIQQAWTLSRTPSDALKGSLHLSLAGQVRDLDGSATLDLTLRDSTGAVVGSTIVGQAPNAQGWFSVSIAYTPSAGVNLAAFATILSGGRTYRDVTAISFPEFA